MEIKPEMEKRLKLEQYYYETYKNKEEIRLTQKEIKPKNHLKTRNTYDIDLLQKTLKSLKEEPLEPKEPKEFTGSYEEYIIPGIELEKQLGGKKKIVNRKIRRLKKYN